MAIGAHRSLRDAMRDRFAVHARFKLVRDIGVAHAASLSHAGAERRRFRDLNFVRSAVAGGAFRRPGISFPQLLAVDAAGVFGGNLLVAACACWFGDAGGVGILFVLDVTGKAGQRGVRPLFHLLPNVMAGGTGGATGFLCQAGTPRCP